MLLIVLGRIEIGILVSPFCLFVLLIVLGRIEMMIARWLKIYRFKLLIVLGRIEMYRLNS